MQDRTVQRSLNAVLLSERERVTRWCTLQIPAVLSACVAFWRETWTALANPLSVLHHATLLRMCLIHLSHWPAQGSKLVTHSAQKLSKTRCPLESGKPRICGRSSSPVHCLQLQGRYVSPLSDWCVHLYMWSARYQINFKSCVTWCHLLWNLLLKISEV